MKMDYKKCRFCDSELNHTFVDLGMSPLANSYVKRENLKNKESYYPLHAYVCSNCFLVQLEKVESPENIFTDYAYFSSFSDIWLKHAKNYANMMIERFNFNNESKVVELASNDGYLLQFFKEKDVPVLGVEPAKNVAIEAEKKGIRTITDFFGVDLSKKLKESGEEADLIIANNVLAHVPDINDFVKGMKGLLKPQGVITVEFPHLLNLMNENEFDTIYHEHYSYLSCLTVKRIFESHGLTIFDVEKLTTHGGSLRIYGKHAEDDTKNTTQNVDKILNEERDGGLESVESYENFHKKVQFIKREILTFLIDCKNNNKTIVGYGAPAKGNTFLNYCGIKTDFLDYTVDKSQHKQGLFLPGTRIPIYSPEKIFETKPDYIVILPWNIKDEVMEQMKGVKEWGCKFVTFIPKVEVY